MNFTLMVDSTTPAPERTRLGAELEQLYAGGKFTEITGPWWMPACPKTGLATSSQARSDRMWCTIHQAFLAERMLEMNKQVKGFLGWL